MRKEVYQETGESAELRNAYCSPNIIGKMKSRRKRWAGHVARIGEIRYEHAVLGYGKIEELASDKRQPGQTDIPSVIWRHQIHFAVLCC
jgi:hypothetical protein